VFSERAEATGIDASVYVRNFLPYLGLELSPWFSDWLDSGFISNTGSLLLLAASYITHSFATTAAIIEHGVGDKLIIFIHPMNILNKLDLLARPDSAWFLAGRFPSLPAALFYQYGAFGFSVFSLLIGFFSGVVKYLYLYRPGNIILLSLYLMMYSVLIISPLLLAIDFMSFPFVMVSFLLVFSLSGVLTALRVIFSR